MSDYYEDRYCPSCDVETEHHFMDDTPRRHCYTARCTECGREEEL